MARLAVTALFLLCTWSCEALTLQAEANPIRKVVTLLQDMQKELAKEGEVEKDMFDKFMCYCDGNTEGMSKAVEEAGEKITELKSKLEAEKAEKAQLDQELVQHKLDREAAKADLEQATSIREKEHADFVEATGDQKENLDSLTAAVDALAKGMGAFLQAPRSPRLERVVRSSEAVDDYQRSEFLALLEGKNPFGDYGAQSGEIVGMLKAMKDEMDKDLNGAISAEEQAQTGFEELSAAKTSEIQANSEAIESKTVRSGDLAVAVTTTADDIEDTTSEMNETEAFVANLASTCAAKKKEWAQRQTMRAEEISAVSEAIKILNDDDALDLFKKTLSLSQSSLRFMQTSSKKSSALRVARSLGALAKKDPAHAQRLALLQYSLRAKSVDFSKIVAQIDGMIAVLGEEQKTDDETKTFCSKEISTKDAEQKDTEEAIAQSTAAIEEMTEQSATLASEMASLQKEIKDLDKAVAEATEQRKTEHSEFLTFQTENNAALQLIEKAKNRLNKFYRPTLYKEAPKRELTEEEKILAASGRSDMIATAAPEVFAQVHSSADSSADAAPPPPPATWDAYTKKEGKSNGVIGLMDMLLKELQDGITEAEHEEETAQKDYERLMSDSQASRATMADSITTKEAAKAELDSKIVDTKEKKASLETELSNIKQYLVQLHAECDFIIENFDMRKAARENEVEGLKNAKSVLSGANFS
jgi:DNA repair exonuclease SbcCD ATPase subunit